MENITVTQDDTWQKIRNEYESTKISMKELAKKYDTYAMKISRISQAEGWTKYKTAPATVPCSLPIEIVDNLDDASVILNPLDILGELGRRKVKEAIAELGTNYSPLDEPLLIAYAESYESYLALVKEVSIQGRMLTSYKTGALYPNPLAYMLESVKANMAKLGDKLGLSIASRKRLNLKIGKKEDAPSLFDMLDDLDEEIVI